MRARTGVPAGSTQAACGVAPADTAGTGPADAGSVAGGSAGASSSAGRSGPAASASAVARLGTCDARPTMSRDNPSISTVAVIIAAMKHT
jgi:hypothetical protein